MYLSVDVCFMRRTIFSLALAVSGALCANAQGIIFGRDDFGWTRQFTAEYGCGDPVGTDNADTTRLPFTGKPAVDGNENTIFGYFWNTLGYTARAFPDAACYEIFGYDGYIRIGGDEIHNQGIEWGGIRWNPGKFNNWNEMDNPDECYFSFDWCPFKASDGTYDPTELRLETRPGDVVNITEIRHDLHDGEPMRWIHVEIDLYNTEYIDGSRRVRPQLDRFTSFYLGALGDRQKNGRHRYYIDNLMLHSEPMSGVGNITVEDAGAPVEYYNLQGVRLAEPEGLVIRRHGKSVRKVIMR